MTLKYNVIRKFIHGVAPAPRDDLGHGRRRLEVHGVAGAGDDHHLRALDRPRHLVADRLELPIALADDQRHRHRQLAEPVPQRRQRAGPQPAQRPRQTRRRVAQPIGLNLSPHTRLAGQPAPASGPTAWRTPRWSTPRSRPPAPVRPQPRLALASIGDPRARPDQHQPLNPLRQRQRDMQRDPPPHRVADQANRAGANPGEVADHRVERHRLGRRRRAVPADVRRHRAVAPSRATTGSQLAPVWVNPWRSTTSTPRLIA